MELFPVLQLSWLGGWILFISSALITTISLKLVPKQVASRLIDRSTFTKKQKIYMAISKLLGLVVIIFCLFTPLSRGWNLSFGLTLFVLGEIGKITAIINFKNTPLDAPVTRGLYKISRHPQEVMIFVSFLGMVFAIGSGIALIVLLISRIPFHMRILAEEDACMQKYGESYEEYMKKVPRYFIFF